MKVKAKVEPPARVQEYALDASAWIHAYEAAYAPDVLPTLWDELNHRAHLGHFKCPNVIYGELSAGSELHTWVKDRKRSIVVALDADARIQQYVAQISTEFPDLIDTKRNRSMGDPFIVAIARHRAAHVVTEEGGRRRGGRAKIPDVCSHYGVRCMSEFEMFRELKISV